MALCLSHKSKRGKTWSVTYSADLKLSKWYTVCHAVFFVELAANTLIILTQNLGEYSGSQNVFILSLCVGCQKKAIVMQVLKPLTG